MPPAPLTPLRVRISSHSSGLSHYQVLNRKTRSRSQEEWKVAGRSGNEVISRGRPHAPQAHTDYKLDRSNSLRKQFTIDFQIPSQTFTPATCRLQNRLSHWLALNRITEWSSELLVTTSHALESSPLSDLDMDSIPHIQCSSSVPHTQCPLLNQCGIILLNCISSY